MLRMKTGLLGCSVAARDQALTNGIGLDGTPATLGSSP